MAVGTPNLVGSGTSAGGSGVTSITTSSLTPGDNFTYVAVFAAVSRAASNPRTPTGMDAANDWGLTWTQIDSIEGTDAKSVTLCAYVSSGVPVDGVLEMNFDDNLSNDVSQWWVCEIDGTDRATEDGVVLANSGTFENPASHTAVSLTLASFLDSVNNAAMHVGRGNTSTRTMAGYDAGWSEINDEVAGAARIYGAWRTGEDTAFDTVWSAAVGDSQALTFEIRAASTATTVSVDLADLAGLTDQIDETVTTFITKVKLSDGGPDTGSDTSLDTIRTYQMSEKLRP